MHMDRGGYLADDRAWSHVFMDEDGVSVHCHFGFCVSARSRYDDATVAMCETS